MDSNSNILVSVIMPMYNAETTIRDSIESVLEQTYKYFELIVVDDGSTDSCFDLVCNLSKSDNRVIPIHQENRGVSAARNLGISIAKGDFITFIDSDDWYTANYLEVMLNLALKKNAQLVMCGYVESVTGYKTTIPGAFYENYKKIGNSFIDIYNNRYFNVPWNKMYRKECIQQLFDTSISIGEDLIFNLKNAKNCTGIVISDLCLYIYNTSNYNSLKSKYHENAFDATLAMQYEIEQYLPEDKQFLLESFLDNYWTCIVQLVLTPDKSYFEKRTIFQNWKEEYWVKCVIKNINQLKIKNKQRYVKWSFEKVYIYLCGIELMRRIKRSLKM